MLQEQMLIRKREKLLKHMANREYVAVFHEHLRRVRGTISQVLLACLADVEQCYISRVEAGITSGIGSEALHRILCTYKDLEGTDASRYR